MKIKLFFIIILYLSANYLPAQEPFNYEITLRPKTIEDLPGIHSYAFAQHNDLWLIIGGRKDGLHARQPFNTFPETFSNKEIYVVDYKSSTVWSQSLESLENSLKEQLQSTNMNFYQIEDTLYIVGGYGYSQSSSSHITYPYLTTINVSSLISAIQNNEPIQSYFKQIENNIFAVTGGQLAAISNDFYLIGGHKFTGRYNPMGNPTFNQEYTNQIRKFKIDNAGSNLEIIIVSITTDPIHLRRRDYNLLPQIFTDGSEGFTISSGVFQLNADIPFLYPVDIREESYNAITSFNQYLSNYHCAVANLYDQKNHNMHSLFFGGISQYYYQNGKLQKDDQVPFVKTISRLTRDNQGNFSEYQVDIEMPFLQGASSEFIPNLNLPHFQSEIIKLSDIDTKSFMIGHIFGGIKSTTLNPFSNNQTNLTSPDNTIFEVWLTEKPISKTDILMDGSNPFDFTISPNPFENKFEIQFTLDNSYELSYLITNNLGKIVKNSTNKYYKEGSHKIPINLDNNSSESLFFTLIVNNRYYISKKIINR